MKALFVFGLFLSLKSFAGDTTGHLYHPFDNAEKDIAAALVKAKAEKKHVLLQIGGNWCVWCYKFNAFVQTDSTLKKILTANYVLYHLNYSKENKNPVLMKKLGHPERFGFPVLVVLDGNGKQLHTQDSSLLEQGNGYSADKVKAFLQNWSPFAVDETTYKD